MVNQPKAEVSQKLDTKQDITETPAKTADTFGNKPAAPKDVPALDESEDLEHKHILGQSTKKSNIAD